MPKTNLTNPAACSHGNGSWFKRAPDGLSASCSSCGDTRIFFRDPECVICENEGAHDTAERPHVYAGQE